MFTIVPFSWLEAFVEQISHARGSNDQLEQWSFNGSSRF